MSVSGHPNICLCILDDVGKDVIQVTGAGASRKVQVVTNDGVDIVGELPNISLFLRNGLYFNHAWAQPVCSPTPASIFTGTHPWRNGIGSPRGNPELPASTVTSLPRRLPKEYRCGLFGKWHLGDDEGNRPPDHGWHKHVGTLRGVLGTAADAYTDWSKDDSDDYSNPTTNFSGYATKDTVEEAARCINLAPENPWFVTIAFHAPHDPFHEPPDGFTLTTGTPGSDPYMFNAMVQNVDTNIGYFLRKLMPSDQLSNTIIIFVGDNGTPADIALVENKETIYEGGVRVPMIVADGHAVLGAMTNSALRRPRFLAPDKVNATSRQLVHVVDLYRTIVEIAEPGNAAFKGGDSVSFCDCFMKSGDRPPVRQFNFSQTFFTSGSDVIRLATIRNRDYKLNYMNGPVGSAWIPTWLGTGYRLYQYVNGEVPGSEVDVATLAPDLYPAAADGTDVDAQNNLNELIDELTSHYRATSDGAMFPRPIF